MNIDVEEVRSWAVEAGTVARQYFNHVSARRKADRSWVTEADETIERMLVERIVSRYPNHGIIGEEQTRRDINNEFLWALDPIDGTGSFVNGLPNWGVSIGLLRDGMPYIGVLYLPLSEECYWADTPHQAFLNNRPIQVINPSQWDSEDWISVPSDVHRQFQIDFPGKIRALGSTIATLAYVARGSAVGGLITRSFIWDVAAGLAILYAAGGVAIELSGQPLNVLELVDGRALAAPIIVAAPGQLAGLRGVMRSRE